ncbi:MAG: hypothetical protein O7F71_04715, partial [Gammaproteobacteria bacterium]|nr:hypothetical protein [Gammaproteobacteria bacterium]
MNASVVSLLAGITLFFMNAPSYSAQTSMEDLAALFQTQSEAEPIRVLTITATHGYRHTPAIEAAKKVLGALNETTEFAFDFTEDVNDFNRAKLEKYDLLFFANS